MLQARLAGGNPPDSWQVHPGSRDAQEAFNALKGSIPSRTDIDKSKFGPYHNWSMNSFAKDKLLPSCVHGAAAPAGFRQAFTDAVTTFVVDKNADRLVKASAQAAKACALTLRLTPNDSLPTLRVDLPPREVRKVTGDNGSIPFNVVSTFHVESR